MGWLYEYYIYILKPRN